MGQVDMKRSTMPTKVAATVKENFWEIPSRVYCHQEMHRYAGHLYLFSYDGLEFHILNVGMGWTFDRNWLEHIHVIYGSIDGEFEEEEI